MSTQYPVLNNRPINLWKVVELREELKKRKLTTKGLKDDLIKRLHEAIQKEMNDFQAQVTARVSPEPEDAEKSVCGESLSNNAKIVGDSGSNSVHGATVSKGQDTEAAVNIGSYTAEICKPKVQDATICSSDNVQLVEGPLISEMSVGASNILTVVSVSQAASIDEALENTIVETDNVVLKSPQYDVDQAEVLKTSLDTHGSFNKRVTTQIAFIEDQLQNDRAKMESEDLRSPLVDDVVIEETEVVEPIMESKVTQNASNDKAVEKSEVKLEKDCLNPSMMDTEYDASHMSNQVYEVNTNVGSQVNFESVSTDIMSNYVMKELDDNLFSDNAHLELEICKSEKLQPSASEGPPPDDVRLNLNDHMPHIAEGFIAETNKDNGVDDDAAGQLSATLNSAHFHDPIVEDVVENNPIIIDTSSKNVGNHVELPEVPTAKDESFDDVVDTDLPVDKVKTYIVDSSSGAGSAEERKFQDGCSTSPVVDFSKMNDDGDEKVNLDQTLDDDSFDNVVEMSDVQPDDGIDKIELTQEPGVITSKTFVTAVSNSSFSMLDCCLEMMDKTDTSSEKRKARDEAAVDPEGPTKRQRGWNFEDLNIPEQLHSGAPGSTKGEDDSSDATLLKCNLPLSTDFTHSRDAPKERIVPPSSKSPTNSLRIDRFLRPFILKAVQELLAKTGKICSFWMDNIKTHCYVTYSSVEEAIETRNAVYNLQWPPNGGRLLLAEFADPEEVKSRLETPKQQPAPPHTTTVPNGTQAAHPVQPPSSTKHIRLQPPPPPVPEKVVSPIVTLDDLFRRTRTRPQIYYLPLTEDQVAAKKAIRSKRKN